MSDNLLHNKPIMTDTWYSKHLKESWNNSLIKCDFVIVFPNKNNPFKLIILLYCCDCIAQNHIQCRNTCIDLLLESSSINNQLINQLHFIDVKDLLKWNNLCNFTVEYVQLVVALMHLLTKLTRHDYQVQFTKWKKSTRNT